MDGFPAPPPVPDETKEAWKKTAFLVSQVGSRLDSAHRIRKTSKAKVYPNTARGRQQLEEDLLKLPVSYIGGGWWSLYVLSRLPLYINSFASLIHAFHTHSKTPTNSQNIDTIRSGVVPTSISTDIHLKLHGLPLHLWKECYVFSVPS